jgi:hypothetical protein
MEQLILLLSVDAERYLYLRQCTTDTQNQLILRMISICHDAKDHKRDYATHGLGTQRGSLLGRWINKVTKFTPVKDMIDPVTNILILRRNVLLRCPSDDINAFLRVTAVLTKVGNKFYPFAALSVSECTTTPFVLHATRVKYTTMNEDELEEYPHEGKLFFKITEIEDIENDIVGVLDLQSS